MKYDVYYPDGDFKCRVNSYEEAKQESKGYSVEDIRNIPEEGLLGEDASNKVRELIEYGWEFLLHFGDHKTYCEIQEPCWEADFTKRMKNRLWDNHESGYDLTPDKAIEKAYYNIQNGIRLIKKKKI